MSFRGVINVQNPVDKTYDINVTVNGFQGMPFYLRDNTAYNQIYVFSNN